MRKALAYLLLATLLFLSGWGVFGCRTIHKLSTRADSTVSRSGESSQKWNREVITEYLTDTLWRTRYDTLLRNRLVEVPVPYEVPRIIYRTTTRESGEASQSHKEEKEVSTATKEKEASTPVMNQISILLSALALFGLIILIFQRK